MVTCVGPPTRLTSQRFLVAVGNTEQNVNSLQTTRVVHTRQGELALRHNLITDVSQSVIIHLHEAVGAFIDKTHEHVFHLRSQSGIAVALDKLQLLVDDRAVELIETLTRGNVASLTRQLTKSSLVAGTLRVYPSRKGRCACARNELRKGVTDAGRTELETVNLDAVILVYPALPVKTAKTIIKHRKKSYWIGIHNEIL